jgi:hypothetical protein
MSTLTDMRASNNNSIKIDGLANRTCVRWGVQEPLFAG